MEMKKLFQSCRPISLYFILFLTFVYFIIQLVVCHMTHALTLLVDAYHMLCNFISLTAVVMTIKYSYHETTSGNKESNKTEADLVPLKKPPCHVKENNDIECSHKNQHSFNKKLERSLINTFGWTRIAVLSKLVCWVFLTALCFSIFIQALQTLLHIAHHDEMHYPLPVMGVGLVGLLINGICYLTIGGYSFVEGSFLHVNSKGEVVLNWVDETDTTKRQSLSVRRDKTVQPMKRQGWRDSLRDVISCLFVVICSMIVYFSEENIAKYVDPSLSILASMTLQLLSIPHMRESCLILLQTIPDHINIDSLRSKLIETYPDIVNIHDLHVWQLSTEKVVSTAHIIFLNAADYLRINNHIIEFFHEHGITSVTIQPEFFKADNNSVSALPQVEDNFCLVTCLGDACLNRKCCFQNQGDKLTMVSVVETNIKPLNVKNSNTNVLHSTVQQTESQEIQQTEKPSVDSVNTSKLEEKPDNQISEAEIQTVPENSEEIQAEIVQP